MSRSSNRKHSKDLAFKVWRRIFPLKIDIDYVKVLAFRWKKPRYGYIRYIYGIGNRWDEAGRAYYVVYKDLDKRLKGHIFLESEISLAKKS